MRGKVPHSFVHHLSTRITPAYAGKSFSAEYAPHSCRDHPRLCGEKRPPQNAIVTKRGSPPPMRGKANNAIFHTSLPRITPAYAGKSGRRAIHSFCVRDHPRLCGEKCIEFAGVANTPGSPPPMRGKVLLYPLHVQF